jgi:hypothetical protein
MVSSVKSQASNEKRAHLIVVRAGGLEPRDDLAELGVHAAARHHAGRNRVMQVADGAALIGDVDHHFASHHLHDLAALLHRARHA